MTLRRIEVSDFRCLHSAKLDFDPKFTLISGPNASGKTSLLESVYVLGRGRSFRTRRVENLIRQGTDRFVIYGEAGMGRCTGLGIEGSTLGMRARMGGDRVASLAELAAMLPVQIIDPEVHRLIEEGPNYRRRFLDWGVFHVEHSFVEKWQQYQKVLKQRNAALKRRETAGAISAWEIDFIRLGISIHEARAAYLDQLAPVANDIAERLLGLSLSMSYRSGWAQDLSLGEALKASWSHDQETGVTQVGPQRAEITFQLDGIPVRDRISRGQQKLLASSLLMAQLSLFPIEAQIRPILLLDDPAAELDNERVLGLIREVMAQSVQLIVTTLNTNFEALALGMPGRHYVISAGVVEQVS